MRRPAVWVLLLLVAAAGSAAWQAFRDTPTGPRVVPIREGDAVLTVLGPEQAPVAGAEVWFRLRSPSRLDTELVIGTRTDEAGRAALPPRDGELVALVRADGDDRNGPFEDLAGRDGEEFDFVNHDFVLGHVWSPLLEVYH